MAGFQNVTRTGIVLVVGDRVQVDFTLQPSAVAETVTVTTEPSRVSTSPAVATVIDRQFVENIPLNGRTFQSLIALTPGVVLVPSGLTNTAGQFSVNGQRAGSNSFMVDGVSANFSAAPGNFGAQDSSGDLPGLSTFGTTAEPGVGRCAAGIQGADLVYRSAQDGRQPGGQISILTRSGTNQMHGSLYDYFRNEKLDANDWFANRAEQGKAPERQNNFGGTFGGPLRIPASSPDGRSRTSCSDPTRGLRLRQPQFNLTNVPTLAMRQSAPAAVPADPECVPAAEWTGSRQRPGGSLLQLSESSELDATSIRVDHSIGRGLWPLRPLQRRAIRNEHESANINLANISVTRLVTQTMTAGFTAVTSAGAKPVHFELERQPRHRRHRAGYVRWFDTGSAQRARAGSVRLRPGARLAESAVSDPDVDQPRRTTSATSTNFSAARSRSTSSTPLRSR